MKTTENPTIRWTDLIHELGEHFAQRAEKKDRNGNFVFENYIDLKEHRFFSAMVPSELGGGGLSHIQMCELIRTMGNYCGSTALAFSMHQHLIAANVWKYQHKGESKEILQKVADQQLVLVSTGARDWLQSNGEMKRTEGGYLFNAKKHFASQSVAGDLAVTSGPFKGEHGEEWVLHFTVSLNAQGVSLLDNWDVMGMRATGSQSIVFEDVFIPDSAIALRRPREGFPPVWHVVLTVALPLIMAAYVGVAERARDIAIRHSRKKEDAPAHLSSVVGRMNNEWLSAQAQWTMMYSLTNNFEFQPDKAITLKMLSYKTNVAEACISTVRHALEAVGGRSFYRAMELERLFRDIQAAPFHPLPRWEQYGFTGAWLVG